MSDLKMTTAGDYMSDEDRNKWTESLTGGKTDFPVVVGSWDLGDVHLNVTRRPTDEQIKNTEEFFGWKWVDYDAE